jgi:hypothetical protein
METFPFHHRGRISSSTAPRGLEAGCSPKSGTQLRLCHCQALRLHNLFEEVHTRHKYRPWNNKKQKCQRLKAQLGPSHIIKIVTGYCFIKDDVQKPKEGSKKYSCIVRLELKFWISDHTSYSSFNTRLLRLHPFNQISSPLTRQVDVSPSLVLSPIETKSFPSALLQISASYVKTEPLQRCRCAAVNSTSTPSAYHPRWSPSTLIAQIIHLITSMVHQQQPADF